MRLILSATILLAQASLAHATEPTAVSAWIGQWSKKFTTQFTGSPLKEVAEWNGGVVGMLHLWEGDGCRILLRVDKGSEAIVDLWTEGSCKGVGEGPRS